ncbi:MAG: LytTR family DNA-binding domain-containing protein [bacterium]|nr:LytTR family DNA-binding domain-containing protein [bacterium]
MLNFIIYEEEKECREKYVSIILRIMGKKNDHYQIVEFEKYNEKVKKQIYGLIGNKIYILDIEVPGKSGLDLAREIRDSGDWESPIIIVSTHSHLKMNSFTNRLLTLDFISKYDNLEDNLKKAILAGYSILENYKTYSFQKGDEIYKIPYNDILYIKKTPEEYYTIMGLKGRKVELIDGIGKIYKKLEKDPRFFRSHRGCIINLNNVKSVDFVKNIIKFSEDEVDLISRDKRKELKDKLCNEQIVR